MSERFFVIYLGVMFLIGGALGGVVVGMVAATRIARQYVEDRMPKLGEFFVAESITGHEGRQKA